MRVDAIFLGQWKTSAPLSLLTVLAMACGAVRNPALESARDAYQKARQDAVIVRHAGAALDRAALALEEADRRWTKDKDVTEVEHLAYIAEKRVQIARVIAQRRLAADEIQQVRSPRP
ncbi:MAG: DUF4398 domain-containing protein [Candidatus Binatia bacterium]